MFAPKGAKEGLNDPPVRGRWQPFAGFPGRNGLLAHAAAISDGALRDSGGFSRRAQPIAVPLCCSSHPRAVSPEYDNDITPPSFSQAVRQNSGSAY